MRFRHDKHNHGILQYHWNALKHEKILKRYLHEPNSGWLIWEFAIRE